MLRNSILLISKELLRSKTSPLSEQVWHLILKGVERRLKRLVGVAVGGNLAFPAQTEHNPRRRNDHGYEDSVKFAFLLLFFA